MPTISVIVTAYNVEQYIKACLDSITAQTYQDFEVIVVNDGSNDNTPNLIAETARQDSRIIVINQENKGRHLARKAGVERASGEYTFFVDGDDDLSSHMCEELIADMSTSPVDILHYGLTVVPENGIHIDECESFEKFNNTPIPPLENGDIIRDIALESRGYQVDWRVTQRMYRTAILRRAFAEMTNEPLDRTEDGYECFVVSALATSYRSCKNCRGYRYHYGRGITGTSTISSETYGWSCEQFKRCFTATELFAACHPELKLEQCALGFKHKAIELLSNDWKVRVKDDDKMNAAKQMSDIFGPTVTSRELWRHIRDRAWDDLHIPEPVTTDMTIASWKDIADAVGHGPADPKETRRYWQTRTRAEELLQQLQDINDRHSYDGQPIRIFITTHKDVDKPDSHILQPVQVGLKPDSYRFPWAFHDDEGENISAKNPMYCELTTQYWAWKNIDAEYYGFCHYRRYFDFSDTEHEENPYGEIMDDYIDADAIRKYGLDDETITRVVQDYDVITTRYGDLTEIIDQHGTPKKVWEAAPKLIDEDLHRMYDILCAMHPDYKQDAIAFLNGNRSCFCNMFIMRKEIFRDYCAWLFPLLETFERNTDMSHYSKEALRTPGHLAERLLNIYLMHHKRIGSNWKTKELQCVHFTNPEPQETLTLLDATITDPIVPVVFAADDNYVPQLTTTIYSAMTNASPDRHYDVVVLQRNISWDKQERMRTFFRQFDNMTLRFINVDRLVSGVKLTTNNAHISVETYYRFLIQQVLPFYDKVLYLDSDIIINGDIAELYDTELGDNLLAAVHDIDFLGNLNVKHGLRMGYATDVLHMNNPYDYFQAGVLVFNTRAMREHYTLQQWLEYASNPEYIYNDQDVLNAHCEGKVTFLDWNWNVMHDCANRVANVFSLAPNDAYDAYMTSRKHPKIIHYAGFVKPWTDPDCDFASVYWRYARQTPFYERLLKKVMQATAPQPKVSPTPQHERAIGEHNALRKVVDPLMPIGSRRREAFKSMGRLIRGKH